MTIKKCTLEDSLDLHAISVETFTETFKDQNSPEHLNAYLERAYNVNQLKQELANQSSQFFFDRHLELDRQAERTNTGDAQSEAMGDDSLEVERIYVKKKFQKHAGPGGSRDQGNIL